MARSAFRFLALVILLLSGGGIEAQSRFRLADPQALSGAGGGWAVDAGTGALSFAIPIATVPGEIPIPAVYRIAASHSAQVRKLWEVEYDDRGRPLYSLLATVNLHRPMLGTLHFGFIDNGGTFNGITESATYVLEDGTQYRQSDWVPYTSYFGTFTLPQYFGLAAVAVGSASVSTDRSYALYTTTLAGLGTVVSAKVQATLPVGHAAPTQFKVVLDKDRARVMAFLSGLNAWAPLLWLDRFGHQVAFKWTVSSSGVPAGVQGLHSVTATNQRPGQPTRGIQIEWAAWTSGSGVNDLLNADFIGVDAPSILVRGHSGISTLSPTGFSPTPAPQGDVIAPLAVAGVVGRPTQILVGYSSAVPEPSWAGSGPALPAQPMVVNPNSGSVLRQWTLAYDSNKSAITGLTDALGVTTQFEYGTGTYPYTGGGRDYGTLWRHGATTATSTDDRQDPASQTIPQLKRTWTRSAVVNNSWTTTFQEWWPSAGNPERKVELGFGSATQPVHYGNKQLALQRTLSADGATEYSKTMITLAVGGLTNQNSVRSNIEVSRLGEATYREAYGYSDGMLTSQSRSTYLGPLETTQIVYDLKKDKLDISRPLSVTVIRMNEGPPTLPPSRLSKTEYDATKRLPIKAYLDGGTLGQIGQTITYDAEGRINTQANFASFSTNGVATTAMTYGTNGYPSSSTTTYTRPANQTGSSSVSQSATYDSAGRVTTETDSRGVQTTHAYDTLGRLISIGRQGESTVSFGYPDERTRTVTRDGRTTTELTDGFGRLVRRTLPDNRKVEFIYDTHGRLVVEKEFNQAGNAFRSSSSTYDPLDRLIGVTSFSGASQTITYSATSNQSIVTTTRAGISPGRKEYRNVLGQVVKVEEPSVGTTTLSYDGSGNLKSVTITDEAGRTQVRTFTTNALGQLTAKTEPETGTQTFAAFNALGLPTTVTEASGTTDARIRTILYDGLGRVCKVSSNTGPDTSEHVFDGPLLVSASGAGDSPTSMAFSYKPAAEGRRLASESTTLAGVTHSLTYAYLASGRLNTIGYPSGRTVGYSYDADGHITGVQDRTGGGSVNLVSGVSFDGWGAQKRLTFGSGAYSEWSSFDFTGRSQTWTIDYTTGSTYDPANPRLHTYDSAYRLTQAGEWTDLLHDGADRLQSAKAPGLYVESLSLTHDVFGNNIGQTVTGAGAYSFNNFGFNPLTTNQLPATTLTSGLTGWTINGRGEATRIGTGTSSGFYEQLGWDALGRIKSVTTTGPKQTYTYAPSGLRIRVQDTGAPSNNRRYVYTAGGSLMSEYTDTGWKRDVIYMGAQAVAEIDGGGVHELHSDHLGTPRIITMGASGQIEGRQAYGPYGERMFVVGYVPLTGYTGHLQTDPTDLIYMRARLYSPAWHRFLNSDHGADPNSWNQMAYVSGSPFMATDPSGLGANGAECRAGALYISGLSTGISCTAGSNGTVYISQSDVAGLQQWYFSQASATVGVTSGSGMDPSWFAFFNRPIIPADQLSRIGSRDVTGLALPQTPQRQINAGPSCGKFAAWSTDRNSTYVFKAARMLRGGWYGAIPLPLHAQVVIKQGNNWYRLSSGRNGNGMNEAGLSTDGRQELTGWDNLYVETYKMNGSISYDQMQSIVNSWNTQFFDKYKENGNNCWDFADYALVRLGVQ